MLLKPEHRLALIQMMYHPSQRGKNFAERKARQIAFAQLGIQKERDFEVKPTDDGKTFNVSLIRPAINNFQLSDETLDLVKRACEQAGQYATDEQSVYEIEKEIQKLEMKDELSEELIDVGAELCEEPVKGRGR